MCFIKKRRVTLLVSILSSCIGPGIVTAYTFDCNENGVPDDLERNGKLYWTDGGRIRRANLDGSQIETIVSTSVQSPRGIALDLPGGKLYWTDANRKMIQRSKLDGTQIENIFHNSNNNFIPGGIAIHDEARKLYWANEEYVGRANLDGTFGESVSSAGIGILDLALDLDNEHVYYTDSFSNRILRVNLNGSGFTSNIVTASAHPIGIALDTSDKKIYYTHSNATIQRASFDGTEIEILVSTGLIAPAGIAIDSIEEKIYWADEGTGKIQRADLDGSNMETLIDSSFTGPPFLAIIPMTLDSDSDGDGIQDDCDHCPNDVEKNDHGVCGCGIPDEDTDGDGALDCIDQCPMDPNKIHPGFCGCGAIDEFVDRNENFIPDCIEGGVFENTPDSQDSPGIGNDAQEASGVCGGGMVAIMPLMLWGLRRNEVHGKKRVAKK